MNHAVIALLVVGLVFHGKGVSAEDQKKCVCEVSASDYDENEQGMVGRVRDLNQQMNRLIARAEYVAMKLDASRSAGDAQKQIRNLMLRIGALKGSGCSDVQFACGGARGKCISDHLVCDGKQDCENNHDEDDATCRNPLNSGDRFKGRVVFDRCTRSRPVHVEFYVEEVHRDSMFPSEESVEAVFLGHAKRLGYDKNMALTLNGRYHFAGQRATFRAPENDGLGVLLQFLPGETDLMSLAVIRESTGETCAKFDLHRV